MNESVLPKRSGPRPRTTPTNPHMQLEQNPEREVVYELARRVFALPGVEERHLRARGSRFVAAGGKENVRRTNLLSFK
jgi:hypothetical protein